MGWDGWEGMEMNETTGGDGEKWTEEEDGGREVGLRWTVGRDRRWKGEERIGEDE